MIQLPNSEYCALLDERANLMVRNAELERALQQAQRLFAEALPKFNWGASCLDANAISLLNEVPGIVAKALKPGD